ncbi:hypothetical protein DBV08_11785 [Rhodococcus sp. KBW08]|uniref:hypothetical protein n=1 Tax=Rhodococcus sp. KBW08 TaxID=2144188 RepID=UPI000F5A6AEA|nr:hypothetical protein [Rhodococcus sp. KBW08]RQO48085.1 hypothetical protein DBV08_11785 [Rhodococcus sp. KBW08]
MKYAYKGLDEALRCERPVDLPISLDLNRTDNLVVWLSAVRVYSFGMMFAIDARYEDPALSLSLGSFDGRPTFTHFSAPLLVGLGFADGTSATTVQKSRGPLLELRSTESRSGSVHGEYLLAPIPPAGPIEVATAWPQLGMDEKVVALDGAVIASASDRVTQLWEPTHQPKPGLTTEQVTHQPQYQRGGWFGIRLD